jgi:hypothetical protein
LIPVYGKRVWSVVAQCCPVAIAESYFARELFLMWGDSYGILQLVQIKLNQYRLYEL